MKLSEMRANAKLALSALERGNIDLARGLLIDIAGAPVEETAQAAVSSGAVRATSIPQAAAELGYSTKHLRHLIHKGALDGAVIGSGRSTRIIVAKAIELLSERKPNHSDTAVEREVAAFKRREALRVVSGGSGK